MGKQSDSGKNFKQNFGGNYSDPGKKSGLYAGGSLDGSDSTGKDHNSGSDEQNKGLKNGNRKKVAIVAVACLSVLAIGMAVFFIFRNSNSEKTADLNTTSQSEPGTQAVTQTVADSNNDEKQTVNTDQSGHTETEATVASVRRSIDSNSRIMKELYEQIYSSRPYLYGENMLTEYWVNLAQGDTMHVYLSFAIGDFNGDNKCDLAEVVGSFVGDFSEDNISSRILNVYILENDTFFTKWKTVFVNDDGSIPDFSENDVPEFYPCTNKGLFQFCQDHNVEVGASMQSILDLYNSDYLCALFQDAWNGELDEISLDMGSYDFSVPSPWGGMLNYECLFRIDRDGYCTACYKELEVWAKKINKLEHDFSIQYTDNGADHWILATTGSVGDIEVFITDKDEKEKWSLHLEWDKYNDLIGLWN